MSSNFDERSGVVYCKTPWGQWGQTMEEVYVEVELTESNVRAREIQCEIKPKYLSVAVRGNVKFKVREYTIGVGGGGGATCPVSQVGGRGILPNFQGGGVGGVPPPTFPGLFILRPLPPLSYKTNGSPPPPPL